MSKTKIFSLVLLIVILSITFIGCPTKAPTKPEKETVKGTVTANPVAGNIDRDVKITLTANGLTTGAEIKWSIDNNTWTKYSDTTKPSFSTAGADQKLYIRLVKDGYKTKDLTSLTYNVKNPNIKGTIIVDPAGGTESSPKQVYINQELTLTALNATPGAIIKIVIGENTAPIVYDKLNKPVLDLPTKVCITTILEKEGYISKKSEKMFYNVVLPPVTGGVTATPASGNTISLGDEIALEVKQPATQGAYVEYTSVLGGSDDDWTKYDKSNKPSFNASGNRKLYVRLNADGYEPSEYETLSYFIP